MRGGGENAVDLGLVAVGMRRNEIVRRGGPDFRRASLRGLADIRDRGQVFVIDGDQFRRVRRRLAALGDHGRHRLADEPDRVISQNAARRHVHVCAIGPLEQRRGRRQGADPFRDQLRARVDRDDAGRSLGFGHVDRTDARVGVRRAQQNHPEGALFRPVVDVPALPGQQPLVLEPRDRLMCAEFQVLRQQVHGCPRSGRRNLPETCRRVDVRQGRPTKRRFQRRSAALPAPLQGRT